MKRLLSALAVLLLFAAPAAAQDFQKGIDAAKRGDYAAALGEWRPLAYQGYSGAQFNLGIMYEKGQGVPQDHAEAAMWYRFAAEQGVEEAQYRLGLMFREGQGVQQDYTEAVRWHRLAAEQGHARAQNNLGAMYARGQGVPQDDVLAHMWFNLAGAQGAELATENRDIVARRMTPDQIAEAQRLAREWKPGQR